MKKLFFLFAVAAMFCCTRANAQFTMIGHVVNNEIYLWDSVNVNGTLDVDKSYQFNWILIVKNSLNQATDLAVGDTLYVEFGINAQKSNFKLTLGKELKKDSVTFVQLPLNVPAKLFVEGDYANKLTSKVKGYYSNGTKTEFEDAAPFTGCFTTVLNHVNVREAELENIRLFPNPVRNNLYIENANNVQVSIYAANGQLINNVTANGNTTISMSDYSAGLYIVKMQNGQATRVEKIQVVR